MSHPLSRRQFFATAAIGAVAAASDAPTVHPLAIPAIVPEPRPAGVARQFGSGRFRDTPSVRDARFSANARWLLWYENRRCQGYELLTGRRVNFRTVADEGWGEIHWSVAGEWLIVTERKEGVFRVRRYGLPGGHPLAPVPVGGEPTERTADGKGPFGADGTDRQLVVRDTESGRVVRRFPIFDVDADQIAVSPDGKTLLVGRRDRANADGRLSDNTLPRLIDADTGAVLPLSPNPPGPIVRVWFPDVRTVAAAFRSRAGHLDHVRWDLAAGGGATVPDPTERNEPIRAADPDPLTPASPDLRHFLRPDGSDLIVVAGRTGAVVARREQPPASSGRWFWLDSATVGVFNPDGLHLWKWATDTARLLPLELPGKWPHVWRWRASADAKTLAVQFFPHITGRACRVAWVEIGTGKLTVSEWGSNVSGEGFTASADANRVAALMAKQVLHVYDREGVRGMFAVPLSPPRFDLSGCGRTLAMQFPRTFDDDGEPVPPALELWEVATGRRRWRQPIDELFADLRCSPCGRFVATCRADQPVYLWDVFGETSEPQPPPTSADWEALASADAQTAFAAVRRLVQHPAAAVKLLSARLKPTAVPTPAWVDERLERLGASDYATREAAERELTAVADVIAERLRAAADAGLDTEEADERLQRVVGRATTPTDWLRTVRAVEVLEYAGVAASPLLARLAEAAGFLGREASAAVKRRELRPG